MKYDKVIFENNRLVVESYNEKTHIRIKEVFNSDTELFDFLYDCEVEFSDNLTVEGFMKALHPFIRRIEYQFQSFIGNYKLRPFFELLDKEPDVEKDGFKNAVEYVEMFWNSEIWEHTDVVTDKVKSEFSKWGGYHGKAIKDGINYSFGLTPLNNWKHHKFKLNNVLTCYKNTEENYQQILFTSSLEWTLHDVLKYFFYELTFYGSLSDIEEFKKTINNFKEIDESDLVSLDDVHEFLDGQILKDLEDELKSMEESENYEAAIRIRNKINKIKKES